MQGAQNSAELPTSARVVFVVGVIFVLLFFVGCVFVFPVFVFVFVLDGGRKQ